MQGNNCSLITGKKRKKKTLFVDSLFPPSALQHAYTLKEYAHTAMCSYTAESTSVSHRIISVSQSEKAETLTLPWTT